VPDPWYAIVNNDDEVMYFNMETGKEQVEHPLDHYFRQKYLEEKAKKRRGNMLDISQPSNTSFAAMQ